MTTGSKYFYFHDRLGSTRMLIDTNAAPVRAYTYEPFGHTLIDHVTTVDTPPPPDNPFMFTGQFYDPEIGQYYLRARQYDPELARFTSRDPIWGKFTEPLSLHAYVYCLNDSVNRVDATGRWSDGIRYYLLNGGGC